MFFLKQTKKDSNNEEFTMHLGNAQINLSVLFLNNPDAKQ